MTRSVKTTLVIGAALLALIFTPAATAVASTGVHVPCSGLKGGAVGLVDAINAANLAGGGTINLASGCTYTLTTVNNTAGMFRDGNGLPLIASRITINGSDNETGNAAIQGENGNEGTTIAGIGFAHGAGFRIFEVDGPGGNLTLNGLTITKGFGFVAGGGILNLEGAVTLDHSQVTGNTGAGGGGGIANGTLGVGPIGTLTLNHSQVNGNIALGGGGGGIANHAGTLTLNFSQVNNNTSRGGGGGISSGPGNGGFGAGDSKLILNFSQVNNNTSTGGAGPLPGISLAGGGIANGGTAVITHSQVNHNTAPGALGGGIINHGTMTIAFSEVDGNKAPTDGRSNVGGGGGIANISFALFGVSQSGVLTIIRSEVNGNSASGIGGGILEDGPIPPPPPPAPQTATLGAPGAALILDHSQVTENSSASGGGIFSSAGSPVSLVHATGVRDNTPNNCFPLGSIPGCSG